MPPRRTEDADDRVAANYEGSHVHLQLSEEYVYQRVTARSHVWCRPQATAECAAF